MYSLNCIFGQALHFDTICHQICHIIPSEGTH